MKTIHLPHDIVIQIDENGAGHIHTNFHDFSAGADENKNGAFNGLESLILAHACSGVDIETPEYVAGIETAVEAIDNNY